MKGSYSAALMVVIVMTAAPGLLVASPAAHELVGEGFTCRATAFATLGGLDAVGEGEVSLFANADYHPVTTTIRYRVRDRVTGVGSLETYWSTKADGLPDVSSAPEWLRIPLRASVPDHFAVRVLLDGIPVGTHRFVRTNGVVSDIDALGTAARPEPLPAVLSAGDHPWLPSLSGHRTLGYELRTGDRMIAGETFLLPDWKRQRGKLAAAHKDVISQVRAMSCGRSIILRPVSPARP